MGTIYAYCRVSTQKQSLARQREKILRAYPDIPDSHIYEDEFTGRKLDRPQFKKLLGRVSSGDTIVFDEVSRMSRDAEDGYRLYRELYDAGVSLVFLANPLINTELYRKAAQIPETGDKDFDETVRIGLNKYFVRLSEKQFRLAFQKPQEEVDNLSRRTSEGMKSHGATNTYKMDEKTGEYLLDKNGKKIIEEYGTIAKSKQGKTVETKKATESKAIILKHSKSFGGTLSDTEVRKLCGVSRNSYYKYKAQLMKNRKTN